MDDWLDDWWSDDGGSSSDGGNSDEFNEDGYNPDFNTEDNPNNQDNDQQQNQSGGGSSGGGSGWASALSALLAANGQRSTNAANLQIAREQMQFQERMSSTAHQREVQDLLKAGLNPVLSASHGGASTPGGASAVMQSVVGAALNGANAAAQLDVAKASAENIKAQTDKVRSETLSQDLNSARATQELERTFQETNRIAAERRRVDIDTDDRTASYSANLRQDVYSARAAAERVDLLLKQLQEIRSNATLLSDIDAQKSRNRQTEQGEAASKADEAYYKGIGKAEPYLRGLGMLLGNAINTARAFGR